jgi:Domain of unknown function (DUF4251)
MKGKNSLNKIILFFLLGTVTLTQVAFTQDSDKDSAVKNLIASQNYVFEAQTVIPSRGQLRQLTYGYDMKVSKDTIDTYLPYFGRAYSASAYSTEEALKFVSSDFDYSVKNRRKGGWDISIDTKDLNDNKKMVLSVQESGYASLQVTSNNRQPISFNGTIRAREQKK